MNYNGLGVGNVQGHIWRKGFSSGSIKAELFRDVPDMLVQWRSAGIKTYIYSSGSREAQKNLFGHTTAGDLRPYLCGFFDTVVGPKVSACLKLSSQPCEVLLTRAFNSQLDTTLKNFTQGDVAQWPFF